MAQKPELAGHELVSAVGEGSDAQDARCKIATSPELEVRRTMGLPLALLACEILESKDLYGEV